MLTALQLRNMASVKFQTIDIQKLHEHAHEKQHARRKRSSLWASCTKCVRLSLAVVLAVRQALFGLRTSSSRSSSSTHEVSLALFGLCTYEIRKALFARTKHFSLARAAAAAHTKSPRLSLAVVPTLFARLSSAFVQVKPTAAHTKCARLSFTASLFVHPHAAKGGCSCHSLPALVHSIDCSLSFTCCCAPHSVALPCCSLPLLLSPKFISVH